MLFTEIDKEGKGMIDWSTEATTLFNNNPGFLYGDAKAGYLNSVLYPTDKIELATFDLNHGSAIGWNNPGVSPYWFMLDGKIYGMYAGVNKTAISAQTLYIAGYMGKTGSLADVYSAETISKLGKAFAQGRHVLTPRGSYTAWVPTLDEFKTIVGTIFQSGIPSTNPAISTMVLHDNTWFLTSTESSAGKMWAINSNNDIKEVAVIDPVSVYMLIDLEFIKTE